MGMRFTRNGSLVIIWKPFAMGRLRKGEVGHVKFIPTLAQGYTCTAMPSRAQLHINIDSKNPGLVNMGL